MSYLNRINWNQKEVNKVYQTSNLNLFNVIKGNRPPNPQHIKRLADSMIKNGMMQSPIIVNENFDVIDGQHRLMAARAISSFIYYIIQPGYGLKEVQELNINQKNWSKKDFMESYADMGIESYLKLRNFTRRNPIYTINNCIAMCSNRVSSSGTDVSAKYRMDSPNKVRVQKEVFEEGTWLGKDFELAQENADKIKMLKTYYDGYLRSTFIGTMLGLFSNKKFDFLEFLNKLKYQTQKLEDCTSVSQYKILIESIYNHRRRDKVNLRF